MTQGIWLDGRRPKSKKEIKEAIELSDPRRVEVEATSMFGNEYDGPVIAMPESKPIYFVGPDPYNSRKFYGTIVRNGDKVVVK